MTTNDGPPTITQGRGTDRQKRNRATSSIAEPADSAGWPGCLSDEDLRRLVRQLDGAVRVSVELPNVDHDLIHAAALARLELRRRRARRRVAEARAELVRAGWSP